MIKKKKVYELKKKFKPTPKTQQFMKNRLDMKKVREKMAQEAALAAENSNKQPKTSLQINTQAAPPNTFTMIT